MSYPASIERRTDSPPRIENRSDIVAVHFLRCEPARQLVQRAGRQPLPGREPVLRILIGQRPPIFGCAMTGCLAPRMTKLNRRYRALLA